jgi:hypothetical protein
LISSQDESAFDILCWAIETFFTYENIHSKGESFLTSISQSPQKGNEDVIHAASDALKEFANSLGNHFRAPQALIRFGSALALLSIMKLCPTFPFMNRQIWVFIVSGVLDTDILTSGIYLSIVQYLKIPESKQIKEMIDQSEMDSKHELHDDIYNNGYSTSLKSLNKSELLDIVVKHSPPISISMIHKLANSLEFIPPKQKVNQLELIRIWGRKSNKLDTYLMKMVIPFCTNRVESVQIKAIEVTRSLLPGFSSATSADITFLWGYVGALLKPNLEKVTLF